GQYVVVFKKNAVRRGQAGTAASGLVSAFGGHVMHAYDTVLSGFSVATDERGARRMAARPNVDFGGPGDRVKASDTQAGPPSVGVARIDQTYLPLDNGYTYPTVAPDVHVFVIDTGISLYHPDLHQITPGVNFVNPGSPTQDCNTHGTHVAGIIG